MWQTIAADVQRVEVASLASPSVLRLAVRRVSGSAGSACCISPSRRSCQRVEVVSVSRLPACRGGGGQPLGLQSVRCRRSLSRERLSGFAGEDVEGHRQR